MSQSQVNQNNNEEELIVLTKAKHDALRKDIDDYKNLLIMYQSTKIEYDILISDLERQTKTSEKTFDQLKKANDRIDYLEDNVARMRQQIIDGAQRYSDAEKAYNRMSAMYYQEKSKVYRMRKQQSNVYIWKGATFFFIIVSIIIIGEHG